MRWILALVLLLLPAPLTAETPSESSADNQRLAALFEQDQADRKGGPDGIDWEVVSRRDENRREEVLALFGQGEIRTAKDFYHAAMIFQHGSTVEEARLAYSLAWISVTLDPSSESSRWLSAAAWDRMLLRQDQPQWYGTQFTRDPGTEEWRLHEVDESAVTDEDRDATGVPSLSEARERVRELNAREES